ncbi:hypothetical protein Salat_0862200 [Sesamum alatum]|uniref:Uncharacterized protein n=1 Tax=Sesamum alatum TaxID=300844 RepID=A0AAE1YJ09_9LAMI|nr:hypothetical protein Salat_0862200 [Sesamum alatum]
MGASLQLYGLLSTPPYPYFRCYGCAPPWARNWWSLSLTIGCRNFVTCVIIWVMSRSIVKKGLRKVSRTWGRIRRTGHGCMPRQRAGGISNFGVVRDGGIGKQVAWEGDTLAPSDKGNHEEDDGTTRLMAATLSVSLESCIPKMAEPEQWAVTSDMMVEGAWSRLVCCFSAQGGDICASSGEKACF